MEEQCKLYTQRTISGLCFRSAEATNDHPILIDQFIENAFEFDVDALCDGKKFSLEDYAAH